jgi:hypothetical protein
MQATLGLAEIDRNRPESSAASRNRSARAEVRGGAICAERRRGCGGGATVGRGGGDTAEETLTATTVAGDGNIDGRSRTEMSMPGQLASPATARYTRWL